MPNNSTGVYTFYPTVSDYVALYRGAIGVWIGDGSSLDVDGKKGGTAGSLYVSYVTGEYQDLGFVSDYNKAKDVLAQIGIALSYERWVELLVAVPQRAVDAEAWAVGTIDGSPIAINQHEAYQNNAKWYAGNAQANADITAQNAIDTRDNKRISVEAAEASIDAKESAEDAAVTATDQATNASRSASAASDSAISAGNRALDAEAWAVGKRNNVDVSSTDETYQNNAKYYSGQSIIYSQSAMGYANNASAYKDQSSQNAQLASEKALEASGYASQASTSAQSCTTQINNKIAEIQAATTGVESAVTRANTAANTIENMTANVSTLSPGASATIGVSLQDEHYVLNFGIPQGANGAKGDPNYLATTFVDETNESGVICDWTDDQRLSAKSIVYDPDAQQVKSIYDRIEQIALAVRLIAQELNIEINL